MPKLRGHQVASPEPLTAEGLAGLRGEQNTALVVREEGQGRARAPHPHRTAPENRHANETRDRAAARG